MASVAHRQEHIIHTVTELWTAVNDSRRYEQENREDLGSLENHTQQIDIALARVVERSSEQMRRLYRIEVLRTTDNIIHEVEVAHWHWLHELDRYTTQLEAVLRGRITHDVLAPHVLREIAEVGTRCGCLAIRLVLCACNKSSYCTFSSRAVLLHIHCGPGPFGLSIL